MSSTLASEAASPARAPDPVPAPERRRAKVVAGILVLAAAGCEAVSSVTPWWSFSSNVSPGPVTLSFYPGNRAVGTDPATVSGSYASAGLAPLGNLYEAVLALLVILALFATIAGLIAVLSGTGRLSDPAHRLTVFRLLILEVVIGAGTLALAAALQPTLISRADPAMICQGWTTSQTYCNSFWGAGATPAASLHWGASIGWYLLVGAVGLLAASLALWRPTRGARPSPDRSVAAVPVPTEPSGTAGASEVPEEAPAEPPPSAGTAAGTG